MGRAGGGDIFVWDGRHVFKGAYVCGGDIFVHGVQGGGGGTCLHSTNQLDSLILYVTSSSKSTRILSLRSMRGSLASKRNCKPSFGEIASEKYETNILCQTNFNCFCIFCLRSNFGNISASRPPQKPWTHLRCPSNAY